MTVRLVIGRLKCNHVGVMKSSLRQRFSCILHLAFNLGNLYDGNSSFKVIYTRESLLGTLRAVHTPPLVIEPQ